MSGVGKEVERLVEEELLAFPPGHVMPVPVLIAIACNPIKPLEVRQDLHDRSAPQMYIPNIYFP
jgi:hypothetical protein